MNIVTKWCVFCLHITFIKFYVGMNFKIITSDLHKCLGGVKLLMRWCRAGNAVLLPLHTHPLNCPPRGSNVESKKNDFFLTKLVPFSEVRRAGAKINYANRVPSKSFLLDVKFSGQKMVFSAWNWVLKNTSPRSTMKFFRCSSIFCGPSKTVGSEAIASFVSR